MSERINRELIESLFREGLISPFPDRTLIVEIWGCAEAHGQAPVINVMTLQGTIEITGPGSFRINFSDEITFEFEWPFASLRTVILEPSQRRELMWSATDTKVGPGDTASFPYLDCTWS